MQNRAAPRVSYKGTNEDESSFYHFAEILK